MTDTVLKTITIRSSADHAFRVFTEGIDTWWPRAHHIGKSPMKRCVVEGKPGGRCYSEQEDGTDCDWGQVLAWDPPKSFTFAWQVSTTWQFEPDLARSSEVEVSFTPQPGGMTRVDLAHRYIARHGAGSDQLRAMLDGPNAWEGTLALFGVQAEL